VPESLPSIRLWISAIVLAGASVLLHGVSHGEIVVAREPLRNLPLQLASWKGEERPLQQQVVQIANVSDYINRLYVDSEDQMIQLYIGYYGTQRTGSTIHSPKNCLPGAGWEPIRSGYASIFLPGRAPIVVNEYVIQRDQDKLLVFYWYQGRGRVIASEYSGKFWMVADAISRNRTDGALVRVMTPVADQESKARLRLTGFATDLSPYLDEFIPR
jgi:EpsI family protein